MLEIALLTILLSFLGPIKNMIYTEVVNKLSLGITVKLGIIMFASYIVVQVIEECVSYFQIYLNTVLQLKLGQSVSHEINNKLAKVKLNSLEMYEIHDLVSRANQTIKSSIVSSLNLIIALYTPLATIVLQLASLVWVAWYVPILIAVFNVPYIFILVKSNHRRYELERKITKEKRVEKYFVELLSDRYAAKDIRTYDLVNFFFSKMIDVKEKITLEYKRLCQKNTFQRTIATVTQSMAMAMALLLTGYLVIKKKTPIGAFVLVYNTGRNLQSAVSSFVGTISTWDQFGINFADWNRLMNLEEEPEGDEDCIDKIHEIEMKNVEFRYPQRSESAVKNINLRILTGEKIAIVGENGSGKTTLLYLLLGIYRPISGEASVNGKTMELNLDNYRKKTACLIQNFVHFQMTLRENLAPNDFSELSEDPLIDFANNFPDRLNTFLGALDSNGVELSGGQWKRIALYRTLHKKDVDLIVLDEPTANLDPKISENIKIIYSIFGVTSVEELIASFSSEKELSYFKKSECLKSDPINIFSWKHFAFYQSSQMPDVADFDGNSLERLVQELNQMFVVNINTIDKTKEILSRYGIKFIIVSKFDKTPIDGFSFWQGKNPTIVLTLRLNKIDNYAFALLHEIYHVYIHLINNREQKYIAIEGAEINKCEEEANKFAKCSLIGKDLWNTFLKQHSMISPHAMQMKIKQFAHQHNINEAIVLGFYQHDINFYSIKSSISREIR